MNEITYSFIIPHKNSPNMLSRCIKSIPERDDIQVIVVDDNSCAENKPTSNRLDVKIIFLDSKLSNGAGHARNVGLDYATGKWLLFADADDFYNEGFLNVLDNYKDTNYDVVYFNFDYKDGKSGINLPPMRWSKIYTNYDGSKEACDRMRYCNKVPWTKMVRKRYIEKFCIKFEEVPNGNDIYFSLMVGLYTDNFIVEKKHLYVYLKNDNSLVNKKTNFDGLLCRLLHRIQLNSFYEFIGHSSWRVSAIRLIFHYSIDTGFVFLFWVLPKLRDLYIHKNEWILNLNNQNKIRR